MKYVLLCLLMSICPAWADEAKTTPDTSTWLNQVAVATQHANYQGVFVYQHQDKMSISRVSHRYDALGEISRLDALSGAPHAYLRINDAVFCSLHGTGTGISHLPRRPFFPEVLPNPSTQLDQYYQIRSLGHAIIADHDCEGMLLIPKDGYRFGDVVWADSTSHVLLRFIKLDVHGLIATQMSFTQVDIGHAPTRAQLMTQFDTKQSQAPTPSLTVNSDDWHVSILPAGFHLINQMEMQLPKHEHAVIHQIYSDGLTTVSLFIEPETQVKGVSQEGFMQLDQMMLYTRNLGTNIITAMGEVPLTTLMMMADHLQAPRSK